MIRKITGQNNNTPTKHLSHNNLKVTDEKDIANHLAETFSQNSSAKNQIIKTKAENFLIKFQSKNTETYNQLFSIADLKESLSKAVGTDKIHYQFLKELPEPSKSFLPQIFNVLWNSGDIHKIWKETTVIPIPKAFKDNTNAINYRPITLSSYVCKTLERMVNARLIWYLETNKLITEYQSGFRSQRSPMDHLIRLEIFIREASIKKEHLVAVFFDLEKAYDTTWKFGIVKDLKNLGLEGRMPIFIHNFLQDRRFRVRMGEFFSEEKQEMGVPQDSVLSVTLFNIKINNIVKNINSGTNCTLYVDDFLICYRARHMNHIERQLQICLDKLHKWTTENGLKFSKEKTKRIHFCNQRKLHLDPVLKTDHTEIPIVEYYKYLGIIFDCKLSFFPHIKYLKTKCNKTIQLLRTRAHTDWGGSKETVLKLYRSLIRSRLDYSCFIYGAARKTYLKKLNTIHHQELRLALGAYSTSPIEKLFTEADEPPLTPRREKLALQYSTKLKSCPSNPAYD